MISGCAPKPEQAAAKAVESLLDTDQPQAALDTLESCLHQYPDSLKLLRLRFIVLLRIERLEPALAAFQRLPAHDPVLGQALHHRNPIVRVATARLIAQAALPISCRDLVHALNDSHPSVRRYSAEAAGHRPNCAVWRPLFSLLHDDDLAVRIAAVTAFGNLGDPRAAGWIIPQLDTSETNLQMAVETALTRIASPANHEVLLRVYHGAGPYRRFGLALALAKLEDPAVLPYLLPIAQKGAGPQRPRATQALGNYASPVVTNTLSGLLTDADSEVRVAAARALEKIQQRHKPN